MLRSDQVKHIASEMGFLSCGISAADYLEDDHNRLKKWLSKGYHASMSWMENHESKRVDPRELVPGARSVISVLYNYYPTSGTFESAPKVSRYAQGEDYHFVLKRKLKDFLKALQTIDNRVEGRVFVDSAPVLDRAWAARSGLGWVGKNSMVIHPKHGSYFFIAELIINVDLDNDKPITDHCGTCTACIDACPTDAIVDGRAIDSNKCISFLTIENKDDHIDSKYQHQMEGWAFGCDICQEVCPWNRFSKPHEEEAFTGTSDQRKALENWSSISEVEFRRIFKKSPLKRAGYSGIDRNISFLTDANNKNG